MSDRAFDFNKFLSEAAEQMMMSGNLNLSGDTEEPLLHDPVHGFGIVKHGAVIPVSIELALDCGFITEEEARAKGWIPTVFPPVPWHRKLRWRISEWRDALALRLYRLVAGHDPEVDCDC